MKLVISVFLILLSITDSLACVCMPQKFTEKYTQSDFVAKARIVKVYKNKSEEELYKADILIYDLYKGMKVKSLYVQGRSDGKRGSSCAILISENTDLIIYAKDTYQGTYTIGYCPGLVYLNQDKRRLAAEIRELAMLNILKTRKVKYSGDIAYQTEIKNFSNELEKFRGASLNKNFALYELIYTSDIKIKSVNVISGFNEKVDLNLKEIIEKSVWKANNRNIALNTIQENSRFLIGFYYYPAEDAYQSFISVHDL
ncbi:hypothetical protein ACFP1I_06470 [Dyadobacter subterraneus]|uniref:Tissue inhibitor of metalloproteinase n=1 Tax=Dyadobacter subterraneus TaxID=2773304 RepID=A0ABR9WIP6_9BACT|nr:hypothetical protein [Dyadobacter subterraneus]MBE9464226.1 hypothetical protein [Dyadobacter subterraneus]